MTRGKRDLGLSTRSSDVADASNSQIAAACAQSGPPGSHLSRAARRDSKRNEAAQLAQELATSGSWSEAFSPRAYGSTAASQDEAQPVRDSTGPTNSLAEHIRPNMTYQDLDPPPAYTKRADSHEAPAATIDRTLPPSEQSIANRDADLEQEYEEDRPDAEEHHSLLGHRRHQRRSTRGCHRGKGSARRWVRLVLLVILFGTIGLTIACVLYQSSSKSKARDDWSPFPSRPSQTIVPIGACFEKHETTNAITGLYQLQERVELTTTTGAIDVEIDPQPGDEPAYLLLASNTGRITLRMAPEFLTQKRVPSRAIFTEIRTVTGAVSAEILLGHGGYATVETVTGQQHLSILLYDVGPEDAVSNITTSSRTGQQRIVLQPLVQAIEPITNINAEHRGTATAALDIQYPAQWMGEIYGLASPLGNVEIEGSRLEFVRYSEHEKMAYRGSDISRHRVEAISIGTGSVSFMC